MFVVLLRQPVFILSHDHSMNMTTEECPESVRERIANPSRVYRLWVRVPPPPPSPAEAKLRRASADKVRQASNFAKAGSIL